MNFFQRLKEGLTKTKEKLTKQIDNLLASFRKIDEELFEQLEEILIESDIAVNTVMQITEQLKQEVKINNISDPQQIRGLLKQKLYDILSKNNNTSLFALDEKNKDKLNIILVVGVNGTGKTTSIGKLAWMLSDNSKKTLLAAADTFRAAASEQLTEWAKKAHVDIVTHSSGADPGAVVYDAIHASKKRGIDVLICDTAGRLHTKSNLMDELKKIRKVINKEAPDSIVETLLVIDASSGQNSMVQAKVFDECVSIDGIILTKLDGTAKGGIIISICNELNIPVKYIGIGEKADDLKPFDAKSFIEALFDI
ncbi:MAG TPA: signal recognition particle-docking protein FtsY [Clostridia bacterium]|jgi:fused signal recognition particle receptor|nr:MAG: Signal recognition particle receptor FtsY [Firmicutes bacterium ADurb.Bin146]HOD92431.1 signal recognition particle-docking protein FtsY [Clostridia bacterium]HQM38788.1 signal recognition particle-docking protein FtsY [Clostridia bacterium]